MDTFQMLQNAEQSETSVSRHIRSMIDLAYKYEVIRNSTSSPYKVDKLKMPLICETDQLSADYLLTDVRNPLYFTPMCEKCFIAYAKEAGVTN